MENESIIEHHWYSQGDMKHEDQTIVKQFLQGQSQATKSQLLAAVSPAQMHQRKEITPYSFNNV